MVVPSLGMNVAEVRELGSALRSGADELRRVTGRLDALVQAVSWAGVDGQRFVTSWWPQHRASLIAAADELGTFGQRALDNASEQEEASAGAGGGAVVQNETNTAGLLGEGSSGFPHTRSQDMIDLAQAGYDPNQAPEGWMLVSNGELARMGIDPSDLHSSSGFDAHVYRDGEGRYVVAFGGSTGSFDPRDPSEDWKVNYASAMSALNREPDVSPQSSEAIALALKVKESVGADNMRLTGHSLGGRNAAIASIATGATTVTYNAAGVTNGDLKVVSEMTDGPCYTTDAITRYPFSQQIINYATTTDPLTNLQERTPGFVAAGTTIKIDPPRSIADAAVDSGVKALPGVWAVDMINQHVLDGRPMEFRAPVGHGLDAFQEQRQPGGGGGGGSGR